MRWDDPKIDHSLDWLTNGDYSRWVLPVRPYDEIKYTPALRELNKAITNALFGATKITKCCENCINNDLEHRRQCENSHTHSMCGDRTVDPDKNQKSFWEPAAGTNIRDLV